VGGIILLGTYVLVVLVLGTAAVGFGFIADSLLPTWSMAVFVAITGLTLWVAWPIAVWATGNRLT
jgi:hypothetical protein